MGARFDDFRKHARENGARRTIAYAGDFDGRVFCQKLAQCAGVQALDFFRFAAGSAQADGEIVGEMIAADWDRCGVTNYPAGEGDHFRGAAADVEQASAEFTLVLREAGFGRGERLEDGVVHADAGAIYRGDNILGGGAGSGDDVDVRSQALADHADCVADIILRVQRKFLREDVQDFAVFGQLHAAGGFDGAAHVVALHIARARAYGDAAAAIHAAHVRAGYADQRGFHRDADERLSFFDGAANGADREIEVDDLAFAPAFRFGRAECGKFHAAAVVVEFADQGAGFGAADVQGYDVPFLLRQIRCSLMIAPARILSRSTRKPKSKTLVPRLRDGRYPSMRHCRISG